MSEVVISLTAYCKDETAAMRAQAFMAEQMESINKVDGVTSLSLSWTVEHQPVES